jgi:hypothetical protein
VELRLIGATVGALAWFAPGLVGGGTLLTTCWPMALSSAASSKFMRRPFGAPWMWSPAFGYHEDRTPTHGARQRVRRRWRRSPRVGGGNRAGALDDAALLRPLFPFVTRLLKKSSAKSQRRVMINALRFPKEKMLTQNFAQLAIWSPDRSAALPRIEVPEPVISRYPTMDSLLRKAQPCGLT